jgi:hypothetical protein
MRSVLPLLREEIDERGIQGTPVRSLQNPHLKKTRKTYIE